MQNPPPSLAPRKRKWIPFLGGQKNWLSGCRREKTARAREVRVTAAPFTPFFGVISSPPPPLSPILIRALALCLSALSFPASSSCSSKSSSTVVAGLRFDSLGFRGKESSVGFVLVNSLEVKRSAFIFACLY